MGLGKWRFVSGVLAAVLVLAVFGAVPAWAQDDPNTILSSTMVFEGALTKVGNAYVGTIPMINEAGTPYGDSEAGFDVYAKQGGCAYVQGYYEITDCDCDGDGTPDFDTYIIGRLGNPHDAYTSGGPWGDWYDPDCADWDKYELELTADHWYLRYAPTDESPMSGTMDWDNMYAAETDVGGDGVTSAAFGGGPQAWDCNWGWGVEVIPLAFPGFDVTIEDLGGGNYRVTMTPADGRPAGVDPAGPVVNDRTGESYGTIQAAIDDAQPGDTILVAAGTYDEQVIIDKELTLQGAGDTTIIQPSQATADTFQLFSRKASEDLPTAAIIVVDQAGFTSVTIKDLKVDGSLVNSVPAGATMFVGILWRGTGGTIDSVTVEGIGITNGNAIYITSYGKTVTTEVKGCIISGYLKNGITANHAGLTANIHNNIVTGSGPTDAVAQNGIQIGYGATGTVKDNTVSNHIYTGSSWAASGILFLEANGIAESNNITDSQYGLAAQISGSATSYTVSFKNNVIDGSGLSGISFEAVSGINVVNYASGTTLNIDIDGNIITNYDVSYTIPGWGTYPAPAVYLCEYPGDVSGEIRDNTIENAGYGIEFYNAGPTTTGNTITGCQYGIVHWGGNPPIHFNNIYGNTYYGIYSTAAVDAENNWWGDASGPYHLTLNPAGKGDEVSDTVDFEPWLMEEGGIGTAEAHSEAIDGSGTIDATDTPEGMGDVTIDATGEHTLTVAKYTDNPGGTANFNAESYFDVHLDSAAGVNSLSVAFCPGEVDTVIWYWDGATWRPCSDQVFDPGPPACVVVTITAATAPNLEDLTGLYFGVGGPGDRGDVNRDGIIDVRDVRLIVQAALGLVALNPDQRVLADVNGDGQITEADAQALAEWLIGAAE